MMLSRDRFFSTLFQHVLHFYTPLKDNDTSDNSIHAVSFCYIFSSYFSLHPICFPIMFEYYTDYIQITTYWWSEDYELQIACSQSTHKSAIFVCAHTSDELHQITTLYETKVYFIDRWQPKEKVEKKNLKEKSKTI